MSMKENYAVIIGVTMKCKRILSLFVMLFVINEGIAFANEDEDILRLLSSPDTKTNVSPTESNKNKNKNVSKQAPSSPAPMQYESPASNQRSEQANKKYVDDYVNMSLFQFYIGIHGGGSVTGTYGKLRGTNQDYIGLGVHPALGGIGGIAIQGTPNFAFRLGINVEHLFKMKRFIVGIDTTGGSTTIDDGKQSIEKTTMLAEAYFDFRSGMWSAFFLKLAGGYSWIKVDGKEDNGATAGLGIGLRWYAHKYITLDWTILDAKVTFGKDISGDLGTQIGVTFQY